MNKTLIFTIINMMFCFGLFSQTKKITATYDSTLSGFGVDPGAYFTIDKTKKSIVFSEEGYDENRQEVSVSEFWIKEARKYLVNGAERENHTNLKNVGKKYEIEYTVTSLGGEDVNSDLYTIVKFNYLDSAAIDLSKRYNAWKKQNSLLDSKNPPPNSPSSVTKQFFDAGLLGDYLKMDKLVYVDKEKKGDLKLERSFYCSNCIAESLKKSKTTPNEIKAALKKNFNDWSKIITVLKKPITFYDSEDIANVYFASGKKKLFAHLKKINGSWKIVNIDDGMFSLYHEAFMKQQRSGVPMDAKLSSKKDNDKFIEMRLKEIVPEK